MSFSAEASFISAGVLAPVGFHCTRLALQKERSFWPFAAIPIGFGMLQAFEGLVWLGLDHRQEWLVQTAARFFLLLVSAWPVWMAFVAVSVETDAQRRKWCWGVGGVNTLWILAVYLPFGLFADLNVRTAGDSIRYDNVDAISVWALRAVYFLSAAAPLLITHRWRFFRPAVLLAAGAAVVSMAAYDRAFTSMWCFLSGVLSLYIWWQFHKTSAEALREGLATGTAAG